MSALSSTNTVYDLHNRARSSAALQMELLHDKILAKRTETERQLSQISAAIDVAMRSADAGALDAGGQLPAAFLALPRFQVGVHAVDFIGSSCYRSCQQSPGFPAVFSGAHVLHNRSPATTQHTMSGLLLLFVCGFPNGDTQVVGGW